MLLCLALATSALTALHVEGDLLVEAGRPVTFRGVEVPSLESSNTGRNVFRSCRVALEDWHANTIRLPVSEDRWLGKAPGQKGGGDYKDTVNDIVELVTKEGGYVWLELAWSDAGTLGANLGHHTMPDRNSETFWRDAAWRFRKNPHVLFGLYRDAGVSSTLAGRITEGNVSYDAVGYSQLLADVRKVAKNVVVLSAPQGSLSDPDGYGVACAVGYDARAAAGSGPVIVDSVRDASSLSELKGRNWVVGCMSPDVQPALVRDWAYEPTPFGQAVRSALR